MIPGTVRSWGKRMKTAKGSEVAAMMKAEHARLEAIYDRLLDAYRAGEWTCVEAEWESFEPALRAHMDFEEARIFPLFEQADPDETEDLRAQHRAFRERLDVLGVNIELHAVPHVDAEDFVERLRAHRAREDRVLYRWVAEDSALELQDLRSGLRVTSGARVGRRSET